MGTMDISRPKGLQDFLDNRGSGPPLVRQEQAQKRKSQGRQQQEVIDWDGIVHHQGNMTKANGGEFISFAFRRKDRAVIPAM